MQDVVKQKAAQNKAKIAEFKNHTLSRLDKVQNKLADILKSVGDV